MPADIPNRRIRGSKTVTSSPRRGATVSLVTARWRSTKSRKPTKGSTSARWRSSRVWTATRRKWTSRFSVSSPRFVLRRTGWKFWAEGRGRRGEIRRPGQRHGGSERQGFRSVPPDLYSDGRGGNFGQRGGVGGERYGGLDSDTAEVNVKVFGQFPQICTQTDGVEMLGRGEGWEGER